MTHDMKVSRRTTKWRFVFLLVTVLICTASLRAKATLTHATTITLVPAATPVVGMARTSDNGGYWIATQGGAVYSFGDAVYHGGANQFPLNGPVVGLVATSTDGGYWEVGSDGGVFAFGDAGFYGSMGGQHLNAPIVGMARTPTNRGYWLVASDGGIFSFGDAQFFGSMAGQSLSTPISGMVATGTGRGYWLVGRDGGVFSFGDAGFSGSMSGQFLNAPVVGIDRTATNGGYWLVGADGGIFSFGGASFSGSMSGQPLNAPVVGLVATSDNGGYWEVASDGGIFAFGNAQYDGRVTYTPPDQTSQQKVFAYALAIKNGQAEPGWNGGPVPYSWGGGHGSNPGPSLGTCTGYTGSITPCPADQKVGVDCSGFVRWVYDLALGSDVLGSGSTNDEIQRLQQISASAAQPGDLVFYGTSTSDTHHVGIYIGNGKMINALMTGTNIETDPVNIMSDLVGYFHYNG